MTADEQYAANVQFLATRPGLETMPSQLAQLPLANLQLLPGPGGQVWGQTWDVTHQQWVALCHPEQPLAEAERDVEALYTRQAKVFCLLGLGLGYFATAFAKRLQPYQRLVIWELDPTLYKAMLYAVDVTPLFVDHRVDVLVGADILSQVERWWLGLDAMDKLYLAPPMRAGYTAHCMAQPYNALLEKTVDMLRYHAVGMATWKQFGAAIGDNDLRNMPEYFSTPGYEHLAGLWDGKPAVCVAAGPSLHMNLAQLLDPAVRSRIALIGAGTVYALLQGLHLAPDIVTTIDFQRLNWTDQFQHVPLDPDCPLVYLHSTYPQTVRRWPGPKFVAENASDTVQWFKQYGEGKKHAAQVQTVAHLNLLVALELGANPIILLGQDLSMPPTAHHAAGARAQDEAPADTAPDAFVAAQDCYGRVTHTRHSFLSMKTVFERLIAEHPDRTFLNCSEGGLPLAGAPNLPLREALAAVTTVPQGPALRQSIAAVFHDYKPQIKDTLFADVVQMRVQVDTLARHSAETLMWEAQRLRWEGCDPEEDLMHDGLGEQALDGILALEQVIQSHQTAWGFFCIRHFGLIELLSALPPDAAIIADPFQMRCYNAARLVRVAQMITTEVPSVQRTLDETIRRLRNVVQPEQESVLRLLAQQHYHLALESFQIIGDDVGPRGIRLYAQILRHTQQYTAAIALLEPWGLAPGLVTRLRHRLAQYATDVRTALPTYFVHDDATVRPLVIPDRGLSGEQLGA